MSPASAEGETATLDGSRSVRARLDAAPLTRVEQRIAAVLLEAYPQSALLTARTIASQAKVSPPSVTRLAVKLGYSSFSEMQSALKVEMRSRLASPDERLRVDTRGHRRRVQDIFRQAVQLDIENLQETLSNLDSVQLGLLVDYLSDGSRRSVYVAGSKKGTIVAGYFAMQLAQLRRGVNLLDLNERLPDALLDMQAGDVLVVFEPRRATGALVNLVEKAKEAGLVVAVFCDEAPPRELASCDLVFRTVIDAVSIFHSYAALFALCNGILAAMVQRRSRPITDRAHRLEELNRSFGVWFDSNG